MLFEGCRQGYSPYETQVEGLPIWGMSVNTCIDINWTRTSAGDDPDGAALQRVIKKTRRWLDKEGEELFTVWVREAPRKGPNSHIMMHLPMSRNA